MLILEPRPPGLPGAEPQAPTRLDVVIPPKDVWEAVMQDLVLVPPEISAGAKCRAGDDAHGKVDATTGRERAMVGVMEDVKPQGTCGQPEIEANEELPPTHSDRQEKGIGGDEPEADNERLTVKSPIPEGTAADQAPVHPRPNGLEKVTATLEDNGVRRRLRLDYHRLVGSSLTLTRVCVARLLTVTVVAPNQTQRSPAMPQYAFSYIRFAERWHLTNL